MKVLSVNAGSSSLKFQVYNMPEEKVLISGLFERIAMDGSGYTFKINGDKIKKEISLKNHEDAVKILTEELINLNIVKDLNEIEAIGHRVVHGGDKYSESILINEDVLKTIEDLFDLAPLHNPANLMGIKAFMNVIPNAISVAVFDTAFHQTLAKEDYLYPLPYTWYTDLKIRKYGFHGTSHKYVSERLSSLLSKNDFKAITCHLGNGASISAIKNGKSVDTSMGFTPNAGVMMGTRSGDIDFTVIPYIMNKTNKTIDEVIDLLNKKSGYLGVSCLSSDSRDIEDAYLNNNEMAVLAQKMYVKRVVDYIAKYYVLLGGVDAIAFAGGIGENASLTRKMIIDKLSVLGIKLNEEENNKRGSELLISDKNSKIKVYVIPTDEEVMIARDTYFFAK